MTFKEQSLRLEKLIEGSYTEGITMESAEKLAGEFLKAQMLVSSELRNADLDSRMRKAGLKAVRASVYAEACSKVDKRPTEAALDHLLAISELVQREQNGLDKAEVERDELTRLYNIFINAHIHFRSIAKGSFNG